MKTIVAIAFLFVGCGSNAALGPVSCTEAWLESARVTNAAANETADPATKARLVAEVVADIDNAAACAAPDGGAR